MTGRASMRGRIRSLRTARPSWPGRREKVAPNQEGGPSRAPVPVLGAEYAPGVASVRRFGYTAAMRELAPGLMVAEYRIDSLIGRGGMGVVYRAFQTGLE